MPNETELNKHIKIGLFKSVDSRQHGKGERIMLKINRRVNARSWSIPNFVAVETGEKTEQIIPLKEVDRNDLSDMCDDFRRNVFKKSGYGDPRLDSD